MKTSTFGSLRGLIVAFTCAAAMGSASAAADCTVNSPSVDISGVNTVALSVSEPLIGYGATYGSGYAYRAPVTLSISCGSQLSTWSLSADAGFTAVGNSYFVLVDPSVQKIVCASGCGGSASAVSGTGNSSLNLEVWCTGGSSAYPKCFDGPVSAVGLVGKPLSITSPGGVSAGTLGFGGTRSWSCAMNSPAYNIGSVIFSAVSVIEPTSASASAYVYKVPVSLNVTCDAAPSVHVFGPSSPVDVSVGGTPGAGQAMLYQASTKVPATASTPFTSNASYGTKTFSDLEVWLSGSSAGKYFSEGHLGSFTAVVPITLNY